MSGIVCATCSKEVTGLVLDKDNRYACAEHQYASDVLCPVPGCRKAKDASGRCGYHDRKQRFAKVAAPVVAAAMESDNPVVGWEREPGSSLNRLLARHADGTLGPEEIRGMKEPPGAPSQEEVGYSVVFMPRQAGDEPPKAEGQAGLPGAMATYVHEALASYDAVNYFGRETIELLVAATESRALRRIPTATLGAAADAHDLFAKLPAPIQEALRGYVNGVRVEGVADSLARLAQSEADETVRITKPKGDN